MKSSVIFIIYILMTVLEYGAHSYVLASRKQINRHNLTANKITINLSVVFDNTAMKKVMEEYKLYHRRPLKNITQTLIRDVEKLFNKPGLNVAVSLNMVSINFIVKGNTNTKHTERAQKVDALGYLNNYCRWQKKMVLKEKLFYSVLFTGHAIYQAGEDGGLRKRIAGKSFKRGACAPKKSCSLMEWRRRDVMSNLLAHELGHSLGMNHNKGKCNTKGTILQSVISLKPNTAGIWTQCNRDDLERYLKSNKSACLRVGKLNA